MVTYRSASGLTQLFGGKASEAVAVQLVVQEGQHPLTGQRAANFSLLANQ